MAKSSSYRGRLAPSPTGYLHLGHARTFWVAWHRARAAHGKLIFRNEDLDYQRCKPEFVHAMYEDLRWLGLDWDEGLDLNGVSVTYEDLNWATSAHTRKASAAAFISTHGASCATVV
jgi:glutamyl/glutaminyl-tRNA synthetase